MKGKRLGSAAILIFGALLVGMPLPAGAELKVGVSGYIKLDIQYGDKDTGSVPSPGPADTPLDGNKERDHSQTIIDARQTRLRATFSDDVAGVKISGRAEFDFFDATETANAKSSNSRRPRLRHAFVRGDHPSGFFLLAGQTWSLVMNDSVAQADLVDFNGPAGQLFARQPQLRVGYRMPLGGALGDLVVEANVEKQSTDDLGATGVNEAQGEGQDVPLFSGKISWLGKIVKIEGAGAVAQNRVTLTGGKTESKTAWVGQVSAEADLESVIGLPLTVFGHVHHVDGLGRLTGGDFRSAFLVGTRVSNVETDGVYGGVSLKLTKNTSVNGVYGYHKADEIKAAGFTADSLEKHQSIHVNVMHKFWDRWQVGLEYRRFDVDTFNGKSGDVNGILGAVWYFF